MSAEKPDAHMPPSLEPRRFLRTFEELRHFAAEPDPIRGEIATYTAPTECLSPGPDLCCKCGGYVAAVTEYIASYSTFN